jgi:hypothetical protein
VSVPAAGLAKLAWAVGKAKERFKLPASVRVVSCYEAGRDGFWLHRHLHRELERLKRERLQNPRSEAERGVVHLMRLGRSAQRAPGSW